MGRAGCPVVAQGPCGATVHGRRRRGGSPDPHGAAPPRRHGDRRTGGKGPAWGPRGSGVPTWGCLIGGACAAPPLTSEDGGGVGRGTRSRAKSVPPTWSHSLVRTQRRGQASGGAAQANRTGGDGRSRRVREGQVGSDVRAHRRVDGVTTASLWASCAQPTQSGGDKKSQSRDRRDRAAAGLRAGWWRVVRRRSYRWRSLRRPSCRTCVDVALRPRPRARADLRLSDPRRPRRPLRDSRVRLRPSLLLGRRSRRARGTRSSSRCADGKYGLAARFGRPVLASVELLALKSVTAAR